MAESKYFPNLQNGKDDADVEQVENAFSLIESDINLKVDKVDGKGLSTNDFTNDEKIKLSGLENYNDNEIRGLINAEIENRSQAVEGLWGAVNLKVDKVDGMGLSDNNFTNDYKVKVDNMYDENGKIPTDKIPNPPVIGSITGEINVNSIYDLGVQTNLSITLPVGQVGDWAQIDFISGVTPTNLIINATSSALISDYEFVPDANTIYTLFFDYGRLSESSYGWRFSNAEYTYREV